MKNANADNLNTIMEFDCPIEVLPDGRVIDHVDDVWAPSVYWHGDSYHPDVDGGDWTLLSGYTGQYSYRGPIMHPSEYIGGSLARDILAEPGIYVAVAVEDGLESCGACGEPTSEIDGVTHHLARDGESIDREADEDHTPYASQEAVGWAVARLNDERYQQVSQRAAHQS